MSKENKEQRMIVSYYSDAKTEELLEKFAANIRSKKRQHRFMSRSELIREIAKVCGESPKEVKELLKR